VPRIAVIAASEPEVAGQPVTQFMKFMLDPLCCFVEEFTAHCLQKRMPAVIALAEVSRAERAAEVPERFTLTLRAGRLARWNLAYHASPFEET